ncbi:MAG: hypothetical protein JWO59_2153, partial [Chloroflexi bacterium]|nr:hypothetical protein [Chloroflexota bacterium]
MDPAATTKHLPYQSPEGTAPARATGVVAVAGLVVVLLAMMGFTYVTTITATSTVDAVRAASQVSHAFQDVRHAADVEAGLQDAYWRDPHAQVRAQFERAAQALDSALQRVGIAAPFTPDGAAQEVAAAQSLRSLHAKSRTAFAALANAFDAGDRQRATAIYTSVLHPLYVAITREVETAVARNHAEVADTLADLTAAADTSRSTILVGDSLGLVLVAGCGLVLGLYRRRLNAATRLEMDHLLRDAMTDALTGLGNHRAFQETFAAAVMTAFADGAWLSLVLVDL